MEVVTRKLHEAVKEIEPTQEEWMKAILFLTADRPDLQRLAAGIHPAVRRRSAFRCWSMRSTTASPPARSESTVLGPFHVADAPELPMGANICLDQQGRGHGDRAAASSTPTDSRSPMRVLDVWQANDEGFYDVQQKGIQPDFNLRGVFRTGAGRALLVPRGEAEISTRSRTTARSGKLLRCARPPSLPAGASPLHHQGRRLRDADHRISSTPTIPTSIPMRCSG